MKVSIRTAGREDILRQYAFYVDEQHAPDIGLRFLDAVESAVAALSHMPDMGAPRFFANPKLAGLRSWPVAGFPAMRIYYIHSADEIRVVRVLHGKRDTGTLLEGENIDDETG